MCNRTNCLMLRLLPLLLVAAACLPAQQPAKAKPGSPKAAPSAVPKLTPAKPGVVSGRVFAITKSGDLKVARLARVYMFYMSAGKDVVIPAEWEQGDPAQLQWLQEHLKASKEGTTMQEALYENEKKKGYPRSEEQVEGSRCRQQLLLYAKAIIAVREWGIEQHKAGQILSIDADEEGNFKIQVPYPGTYGLIARGRAGFNEAFWTMDNFLVEQGTETVVKVGSVEEACLEAN